MKKTHWWDKTITWKSYFKFTGICCLISMVYTIYVWIKLGLIDLPEWVEDKLGFNK